MPHIRAKKYQAMEDKIKLLSDFVEKSSELDDMRTQLENEMKELKVNHQKKVEELDLIIYAENKKESCNKNGPDLGICLTEEEKKEEKEKRKKNPLISFGYKCEYSHQPKRVNGTGSQEQQWSSVLGIWVDWRSPLSP